MDNYLGENNRPRQNISIVFMWGEKLLMKQSTFPNRDGFHILVEGFALPADNWKLDPQSKRTVTICNLFVNHQYNIPDIVRVLDENHRKVVLTLLKQGIIKDRRVRTGRAPDGIERRTISVSVNVPQWATK